jgi:thiamine biosynthesis lipoprotein
MDRPARVLLLLLLLLSPAAPATGAPPDHDESRQVMGTLARVAAWASTPDRAGTAADAAWRTFDRVDSLMSTWRDDSVLMSLNRAPVGTWVDVGPEVASVLAAALEVAELSGGAYDPTVLPLVRLWGFRGGEPSEPSPGDLAGCLALVGYRRLEVDRTGGRARRLRAGVEVDLGGIAKGYALDAATRAMRRSGAESGALDLGGNLLVFGPEAAAEVGLRDPRGAGVLAVLPLAEGAAATSGQYERFVMIGGSRFGHILDPRTGRPVPGNLSVTVLAPDAMRADALATAAVVLGPESGLALLEDLPDVEGLLVLVSPSGDPVLHPTTGLEEAP